MPQYEVKISVRNLIEYTLRSGSIVSMGLSSSRAVDGTKAHQKFQKAQDESYEAEVALEARDHVMGIDFILQGRMDGLIHLPDGRIMIDEIKTVGYPLRLVGGDNLLHWAQVKMYAHIYASQHGLEEITCRLTYIELETEGVLHFEETLGAKVLENFYYDVLDRYARWALTLERFEERCLESVASLAFPFDGYREGQKQLMGGVYKTIHEGQKLFARAPTGIGKTIATLFPAIKALGVHKTEKIFYLTAKTIGKEVAAATMGLLDQRGLVMKRLVITAKDKICFLEERKCDKETCPYADGHYDRVNKAIDELYESVDYFSREAIEAMAMRHRVCPYELSLDMALFSQVIICDYNYVFDPTAMLRRFFVEGRGGAYTILVDEAHNLVDRGRSMYSATLTKESVLSIKRKAKELDPTLHKYVAALNQKLVRYRKECESYEYHRFETKDLPYDLEDDLRAIMYRTEKVFKEHADHPHMEELLDFFFMAYDYLKKTEFYSDKYLTYYEKKGTDLVVTLFCINPSDNLKMALSEMHGVVFFSATLMPMAYYMDLLGGSKENYGLMLPSPFDPKNLGLVVDSGISTRYINRDTSIMPIAKHIRTIAKEKQGNYLVFFPSYKYMEDVLNQLVFLEPEADDFEILYQERGLTEEAKEAFINAFSQPRTKSLVAFSVLGGMFSEGIDLVGDRLIGTIIVGVGLPMICYENDLIRAHFDETGQSGFDYAYVYPGMNKVLQAAGRVIRTESDKGVVVLLDERFNQASYRRLMPKEWDHLTVIRHDEALYNYLEEFWSDDDA